MRPGHGRQGWACLSAAVSRALSHATRISSSAHIRAPFRRGEDRLRSAQGGQCDQATQLPKATPQRQDPASSGPRSLLLQAAFQGEFRRLEDWVTVPKASRDQGERAECAVRSSSRGINALPRDTSWASVKPPGGQLISVGYHRAVPQWRICLQCRGG